MVIKVHDAHGEDLHMLGERRWQIALPLVRAQKSMTSFATRALPSRSNGTGSLVSLSPSRSSSSAVSAIVLPALSAGLPG